MEDGVPGFSLSSKQQSSQHRVQQMIVNAVVSNFSTLKRRPIHIKPIAKSTQMRSSEMKKKDLILRIKKRDFFFNFSPSPLSCQPSSPLILAGGPCLDCLGCEEPGWRQPSQQAEPEETPAPSCPCWGTTEEVERQRQAEMLVTPVVLRASQELTPPAQVWGGPLWTVSCGGDILTGSNICLARVPTRDQKTHANAKGNGQQDKRRTVG